MAGLSEFDSGFAFMNVATTTSSPKTEDLPLPNEIRCQLIIASLFTVVGGYLDAFSFLACDHVFANAQTGNVVLFAVFASAGDWSHAARYLPPIAAFACGVSVAELSGVHLTKHSFRATLLCQGIELIVISVLAALGPWYPTQYIVPTISFAVGLQITSFDAIGPWLFNSAMMTANIRQVTAGTVLWCIGRDRQHNGGRVLVAGMTCFSFLLGALLGGVCTRFDKDYALVPCAALLFIGFLLTLRQQRKSRLPKAKRILAVELYLNRDWKESGGSCRHGLLQR